MLKLTLLTRISSVLVVVFLNSVLLCIGEIPVPPAGEMIRQANLVCEGKISSVKEEGVVLRIEKVFKGDIDNSTEVKAEIEYDTQDFDWTEYAKSIEDRDLLFLGHLNAKNSTLSLPWSYCSIWPIGYQPRSFPSHSNQRCREFIISLLGYERVAQNSLKEVISLLLRDFQTTNKYAVLSFLNSYFQNFGNDGQRKQILSIILANTLLEEEVDQHVTENLLHVLPILPPALSIRYLFKVANSHNPKQSATALSRIRSTLYAYKIISKKEKSFGLEDLKNVYKRKLSYIQLLSAKNALSMFKSKIQPIRRSANLVLESIFDDYFIAQRCWEEKINDLSESL